MTKILFENNYKSKRFLLPILSLVLLSIILIATISSYLTISMFNNHMEEHIEQTKKEYIEKQKTEVFNEDNHSNTQSQTHNHRHTIT